MTKKIDPLAQVQPKVDVMNEGRPVEEDDSVPFDSVPLPSKGKLYEVDHPLYMQSSVEIKAMDNVEENILHSSALIKKGTVVTTLIRSCLMNKSIDPETLLIGDKAAILIAIRISGLTQEYRTKTVCPECEEMFPHSFDLSKCEIKPLGAEPSEPGQNLFDFTLPNSGAEIKFKLLTAGDERDITDTQAARVKAMKKQAPGASQVDTNITDRLTKAIVSWSGDKDKFKIAQKVQKMKSPDSRALRSYVKKIVPDLSMVQVVECPNPDCGEREEHNIPMGIDFLWPKL